MLGLGVERLRADMNRLLAFLFHQVIDRRYDISLSYMFMIFVLYHFDRIDQMVLFILFSSFHCKQLIYTYITTL